MKQLMIAAATVALMAGGLAMPAAAGASASHPSAHHHKHHAKNHDVQPHPCDGLGIDLALGSQNICIPL
jgi:hypothetical protein